VTDDLKIDDLSTAVRLFKESRSAFLQLFDASPIGMSMTTMKVDNRVYVRVNKKFVEIFGFAEEEILGHTSAQLGILDIEESARVGSLIKEKGGLQNDYVRCLTKDGTVVHTISSIEPMLVDGVPVLVSFFVNITEVIEQRAQIERHARQLESVNKELETFSYTVSHDLRNPLGGIEGCAKLLEQYYSHGFDEDGKKLLALVRKGTEQMRKLITDLLDFARLGKLSLKKSTIDMNEMIHDILVEIRRAMNHNAEITVQVDNTIHADPSLMRQVMLNLISNAVKFSSKKEHPQVHIASAAENGIITFTITDNGAGFDMAHAGKLFGAFQRLHGRSEFEGTGVGLATVERIIKYHGGTVTAEGEVGKGAKFMVRIPA
jgi:PAS domain S-box-containing protein